MRFPWKEAGVCLLRKEGKTLFVDYTNCSHPIHEGFYAPPGGKKEEGETILQATQREIREEVGIIAHYLTPRGIIRFHNEQRTPQGRAFKNNFNVYIYDCMVLDDAAAASNDGGAITWVEDAKIPGLRLSDGDYLLWKWLDRYTSIDGSITHAGKRVASYTLNGRLPNGAFETLRYP